MTTSKIELLAAYFTLAGDVYAFGPTEISPFPFRDRVEAAARAGYRGMGFIHADLLVTAEKIGYPEMKRILDANGIKHVELEFIVDWYLDGERRRASDKFRREILKAAQALGARDVKIAPGLGVEIAHPRAEELVADIPRMRDAFAGVCRDAAEYGTAIVLEIMPFSNVRTIDTALAIVGGANQPNGGILVDVWHISRGGMDYSQIAKIPPQFIGSTELDDADESVIGTLWDDTLFRRRLCGEGVLNPSAFIKMVQSVGYSGPWGVEILSETLRKLPLDEMARRSFDTTLAQFPK
jgi:sugar phosphate isomerase/epimerase